MKKLIGAIMVVVCIIGLTACSNPAAPATTPGASISRAPTTATTTPTTNPTAGQTSVVPTPTVPTSTANRYENGKPYYPFGENYTLSFQIDGRTVTYSANFPKGTKPEFRNDRLAVMWTEEGVSVMTGYISKDAVSAELPDVYSHIAEQMNRDYKDAYIYFKTPGFRFLTPKTVMEGSVAMCKAQGIVTYYLSGSQNSRTFICYITQTSSGDFLYWCTICSLSNWTGTEEISENIAKTFREVV